jgi:hypothetical protein
MRTADLVLTVSLFLIAAFTVAICAIAVFAWTH